MNDPSITPIAVAVVIDGDQVLIGKRAEGVALAGLWEFPGGKIEPGETPAQAAARECLEEAALAVHTTGVMEETQHTYDHGTVRIHFVRCEARDTTAPLQQPFRWVRRESLTQYEFPAANAEVVQRLLTGE